jgi:hypothetical protein
VEESADRKALRALVEAVQAPDAVVFDTEQLRWKPKTREAISEAQRALASNEDTEGYPTVTLTLPLRSARASRDSLRNALCFLRGMRAGAGPDAEDGPEDDVLAGLRALAQRLDEVVEPALSDFEGPQEMPF